MEVLDQQERPMAGEAISIQNSDYFLTDDEGVVNLNQTHLQVPVRASFQNENLEIQEIAYFEEEGRLKVNVLRLYQPNDVSLIVLLMEDGQAADGLDFRYQGKSYKTNAKGESQILNPVTYVPKAIELNGYNIIEESFHGSRHALKVVLKSVSESQRPIKDKDTLMLSYETDFERITKEIENERILYEEKNHEIQAEIFKIRDNLINEEEINPQQRLELKGYLGNMERALLQNSLAVRQSEERTKEAISKLRMIIMEKDSLNMLAQGKIVQMEEEKVVAEQSYKQKIAIYSAVIVVLVILALLIYIFAVKFRRQKQWLAAVNKKLKSMQQELTRSLQELNLRKAQIEDHNNQLEHFVYKASHDIKGPLRSIIGLTQIGLADVKDAAAQEYFTHIHTSTKRLDKLLADLLLLTKARQAEVEKQEIMLPEMVDEIIQSFKNVQYFDRVKINVTIQEGLFFESDEKMLYSVIQNFVENGIKYCDPSKNEPFLNISVRQEPGKTTFLFEDNGLGIDKDHLSKVFDMFFKIDAGSEGTGLGLHIVKISVQKLGGSLNVKSSKGKGSLFTITFYA